MQSFDSPQWQQFVKSTAAKRRTVLAFANNKLFRRLMLAAIPMAAWLGLILRSFLLYGWSIGLGISIGFCLFIGFALYKGIWDFGIHVRTLELEEQLKPAIFKQVLADMGYPQAQVYPDGKSAKDSVEAAFAQSAFFEEVNAVRAHDAVSLQIDGNELFFAKAQGDIFTKTTSASKTVYLFSGLIMHLRFAQPLAGWRDNEQIVLATKKPHGDTLPMSKRLSPDFSVIHNTPNLYFFVYSTQPQKINEHLPLAFCNDLYDWLQSCPWHQGDAYICLQRDGLVVAFDDYRYKMALDLPTTQADYEQNTYLKRVNLDFEYLLRLRLLLVS